MSFSQFVAVWVLYTDTSLRMEQLCSKKKKKVTSIFRLNGHTEQMLHSLMLEKQKSQTPSPPGVLFTRQGNRPKDG